MRSVSEDRLTALRQVLEEKLVKRKVSLKALDYGKVEDAAGGTVRQVADARGRHQLGQGPELNKFIKGLGPQGRPVPDPGRAAPGHRQEARRPPGGDRRRCKEHDFGIPLQFGNFRD